jgi:hypothetical protein
LSREVLEEAVTQERAEQHQRAQERRRRHLPRSRWKSSK